MRVLSKAAAAGDLGVVKQLVAGKAKLDIRGQHGWTPLIAAIANDKLAVALYLIEQGANVSVADKQKDDPLKWAAVRSGWVMSHQNVKLAEALLDRGAPVDAPDKDGYTPLMWAANRKAVKLVNLLRARGADVNAKCTGEANAGWTALMLAKGIAAVQTLLDAGADPKAVADDGRHTWEFHTGAAAKLLRERAGKK